MARAIRICDKDNVAVCLGPVKKGDIVNYGINEKVVAIMDIPVGHKIAIKSIEKGNYIIKYGEIIGIATEDIQRGAYVHVHNVGSLRFKER